MLPRSSTRSRHAQLEQSVRRLGAPRLILKLHGRWRRGAPVSDYSLINTYLPRYNHEVENRKILPSPAARLDDVLFVSHSTSLFFEGGRGVGWGWGGIIVQELCESRGGRPGLSVLTSLLVSVDVSYSESCFGIGLSLSLICQLTSEDVTQHYLPTYLPTGRAMSVTLTEPGWLTPHSEHGFPAPSSTLCQIWLRH